ncbi:MAG: hypothetical protein KDC00_04990 [Flavobacteriales bacterium]|nr:hypothetical protein [Flavobacteriales bacterium]
MATKSGKFSQQHCASRSLHDPLSAVLTLLEQYMVLRYIQAPTSHSLGNTRTTHAHASTVVRYRSRP